MYTAYVLTDDSRSTLMDKFAPKYDKVIGHHITVEFGVPDDTPVPDATDIKVVGHVDSGDGLQTLVCSVNGTTRRPDGGTYHITWSLDPDKYKPVNSNDLLRSQQYKLMLPVAVDAEPKLLK